MNAKWKTFFYGYIFLQFIGPVILVSPSKNQATDCGNVPPDECLGKLQTFLKLTSLPFTSQKSQLDKLCDNTAGGYNCSVKLVPTPDCLAPKDKDLFPVFINMAEYTYFMFCATAKDEKHSHGYLKNALLENSECILKQQETINCCAEQSKVPELPIMYILEQSSKSLTERQINACCPVANYIKCVQNVLLANCGEAASNLTFEYIRRASGEQFEAVCQKMPLYPDPDPEVCEAPLPVCAGSRIQVFIEHIALISVLFAVWTSYI